VSNDPVVDWLSSFSKFDMPGVNAEGMLARARLWGPELAVASPGLLALARLGGQAVESGAGPLAITAHALVAVPFVGVAAWWRRSRPAWRRARRLRVQWEAESTLSKSSLGKITVRQGIVEAKCKKRRTNWDALEAALDPQSGGALEGLRLDRSWGWPARASFDATGPNSTKHRVVKLHYLPLGDPESLPIWERPADGTRYFIGYDQDGPAFLDLADTPHVAIRGATSGGKGVELRTFIAQGLRAGSLVLVIDGGNSAEHAVGDAAPTYWRPMRATMSKTERYQAAIDALEVLVRVEAFRTQIGELLVTNEITDSSEWRFWPDDLKAWQPQILFACDEMTTLLAKGDLLRNARKFGINVVLVDQTATLSTSLAHGDVVQAEHVIVFGDMDSIHARQATDHSKLPKLSGGARRLAGFYVRRGTTEVREIRVPLMKEPDLRRAALSVRRAMA
jgi:hypothetical protein